MLNSILKVAVMVLHLSQRLNNKIGFSTFHTLNNIMIRKGRKLFVTKSVTTDFDHQRIPAVTACEQTLVGLKHVDI